MDILSLDSLQELTRILESGRKYRTKVVKNMKCSIENQSMRSLRTDSSRIDLKHTTNTLENSSKTRNKQGIFCMYTCSLRNIKKLTLQEID